MEQIVIKHVSELKDHPLNDVLYDKIDDNRDKLRASLLKSKRKNGYANKEPLYISKNYYVYSGHRRKWASEEDETGELGELRCIVIDRIFDPNSLLDPIAKQKEIELLDEYNEPDIIRNQTSWSVVLRKYSVSNNIQYEIAKRYFTPKERNKWCVEKCSYPVQTFKKMVEIYESGRIDLIKKVEKEGYSINKAYKDALNVQPPVKLEYDKDRKNWVEFFKERPDCRERVVKYANDLQKQYLSININGRQIPLDMTHGFEQNMISTNLSNSYMSALSIVLEEEGFKSFTPRQQAGDPDVVIKDLCKPGFHPEKIEVKVAKFNGHGSKTSISAGPRATTITPHPFLNVVYDPETNRQFVVLSDLTKDDWTANTKNTKCEMGMNVWADNHLDDCVFFHGDGYIDNRNVFNMNLKEVK